MAPFLEGDRIGELILVFAMYVVLVASTVELTGKKEMARFIVPLVALSMVLILVGYAHPARWVLILYFSMLSIFFGIVSVGLFAYLGRTGSITSGRIYASVSLYFILSLFWFALYNVINTVYPGSFVEPGPTQLMKLPRASLMYFSVVTLTTLGYGDIVPVTPVARMLAALEAATGVLYMAITVARLVAAYQRTEKDPL